MKPVVRKKKDNKDKPMLLALLLFLGAAGLVFAYLGSSDSPGGKSGKKAFARSDKFEGTVNKHLMFTNDRVELQKRRVEVENAQLLNKDPRSINAREAYSNDSKLDLSSEDHASEIAKELGRGPRPESISTPDDVVQREMYNAQMAAEYSQAYKEEYARQFVENARRGGYKVILSEDLSRVLSVVPLRNPSKNSFEVFGNAAAPIQ